MSGSQYAAAPDPEWQHEADAAARGQAEELVELLVPGDPSGTQPGARSVAAGSGMSDVGRSLEQFDRQHRVLTYLDLGFPCVDLPGSDVPLPIALPVEAFNANEDPGTVRSRLSQISEEIRLGDNPVRGHDPDRARGFLHRRLVPFLATRIATTSTGVAPPGAGCKFTVETTSGSGLRVHYSNAYFFDPTNVFGNTLSTPVDGYLQPGRYVFGTMAPQAASPTWDFNATYRVPGPPDVAQVF